MTSDTSILANAGEAAKLAERLEFVGLADERARHSLRRMRPLIEAHIEPALAEFYRQAEGFPATQQFFSTPQVVQHAKQRQAEHWKILSEAHFDAAYVRGVRAVGETHARLGLPPQWYIGAYSLVTEQLLRAALATHEDGPDVDGVASLMKAVFLDMELAISIYLDALEERRRREELARLVAEQNQTAVVRALAGVLAQVAAGDLTARVEDDVSPEYRQLKDDFNSALERLVEAQRGAEAASREKSDFLGNISHEIRTPLNGVIGVAGALSVTALDAYQREMVDLITVSAKTVERLLSDVLDVAKLEAGAMQIECAPFQLRPVIEGAVELFRAKAREKGVALRVTISEAADCAVVGDAVRIAQVVTNLVSNAVKFTSEGEVSVQVEGGACDGRHHLTISVADTGPGFDPALTQKLFDRFSQADTSITRRYGGTGLGLSICKGIVEAMGGTIEAESTPGRGSLFTASFHLPAAVLEPMSADAQARTGHGLGEALGLRVLLAEDHPVNRLVVRMILDPMGVEVVEAVDGQQALDQFQTGDFAVVLMDMQMPVMDGLAATEAIRALETGEGRTPTPVIMLTANVSETHREAAMSAGASGYLAKPINREELVETIAAIAARAV
jgi:signal transduction histidine kinase